jgi:hypothetical protein
MIVGCYTMDLYCDNRGETHIEEMQIHGHDKWPIQYTGHTEGKCKHKARQDGWRLGKEKQLCPVCTGKNKDFLKTRYAV